METQTAQLHPRCRNVVEAAACHGCGRHTQARGLRFTAYTLNFQLFAPTVEVPVVMAAALGPTPCHVIRKFSTYAAVVSV